MAKFEKGNTFGKGRKPGSRNRTVLQQAQKIADDCSADVVKLWKAIVFSDVEVCAQYGIDASKIKTSDKLKATDNLKQLFSVGVKELEKVPESKPTQQAATFQKTASVTGDKVSNIRKAV